MPKYAVTLLRDARSRSAETIGHVRRNTHLRIDMSMMHVVRALLPYCVAGAFALAAPAQAREDYRSVGFAPGQTAVELYGTAPPEDVVCFKLTGLRGQSVSITVTEGANIIFSIEEMVDAQDRYRFTATRPTYRICNANTEWRRLDAAH